MYLQAKVERTRGEMTSFGDVESFIPEDDGWPVQRLRMGWALVLFFFFEMHIGRQLPQIMPFLALGLGVACLISAHGTIREMKLQAQISERVRAIDRI